MTAEESFAEFHAASRDPCLRALVASGPDRAAAEEAVTEEVVAEAFARAWGSRPEISRHPAPSAWVVRVALDHHVSRWRRTRREVAHHRRHDVARDVEHGERADLLRAVAALPEPQRQVVALRVLLDRYTEQTAAALRRRPPGAGGLHRGAGGRGGTRP